MSETEDSSDQENNRPDSCPRTFRTNYNKLLEKNASISKFFCALIFEHKPEKKPHLSRNKTSSDL